MPLRNSPDFEKILSVTLGLVGIVLIALSRINMTGGVIGVLRDDNFIMGALGMLAFIASLVLLILSSKREN